MMVTTKTLVSVDLKLVSMKQNLFHMYYYLDTNILQSRLVIQGNAVIRTIYIFYI